MKYLITGVAGFYGHHLSRYLKSKGNYIYGLDNLSLEGGKERLFYAKYDKFFKRDLRKKLNLDIRPDIIIHLAALSHVDKAIKSPINAVLDNVLGTANILEYARWVKPKLFIYFSTDEVFGPNNEN